jgi:hypothetical protein
MQATPLPAAGALRRTIILAASAGVVRAGVEDDFHHFELAIAHDGKHVTAVQSRHLRTPWTSCAGAGAMLAQLVGAPLSVDGAAVTGKLDPHAQCTHQFDLALMAIAQGARGGNRRYDIEVHDPLGAQRRAIVRRDGAVVIDWLLEGSEVAAPEHMAGTNLRAIDLRAIAACDPDHAEALVALRRAVMISAGRGKDLDQHESLDVFSAQMSGACYAFQPVRFAEGKRNKGSVRDFADHPQLLLKDFAG